MTGHRTLLAPPARFTAVSRLVGSLRQRNRQAGRQITSITHITTNFIDEIVEREERFNIHCK